MSGFERNEKLLVALGGEIVHCSTAEEAADVTKAAEILHGIDYTSHPHDEIERLAMVLRRYGRQRAANTLVRRSRLG
jgi:hypothetical protein